MIVLKYRRHGVTFRIVYHYLGQGNASCPSTQDIEFISVIKRQAEFCRLLVSRLKWRRRHSARRQPWLRRTSVLTGMVVRVLSCQSGPSGRQSRPAIILISRACFAHVCYGIIVITSRPWVHGSRAIKGSQPFEIGRPTCASKVSCVSGPLSASVTVQRDELPRLILTRQIFFILFEISNFNICIS
jgi:hypothetical protein